MVKFTALKEMECPYVWLPLEDEPESRLSDSIPPHLTYLQVTCVALVEDLARDRDRGQRQRHLKQLVLDFWAGHWAGDEDRHTPLELSIENLYGLIAIPRRAESSMNGLLFMDRFMEIEDDSVDRATISFF